MALGGPKIARPAGSRLFSFQCGLITGVCGVVRLTIGAFEVDVRGDGTGTGSALRAFHPPREV